MKGNTANLCEDCETKIWLPKIAQFMDLGKGGESGDSSSRNLSLAMDQLQPTKKLDFT